MDKEVLWWICLEIGFCAPSETVGACVLCVFEATKAFICMFVKGLANLISSVSNYSFKNDLIFLLIQFLTVSEGAFTEKTEPKSNYSRRT